MIVNRSTMAQILGVSINTITNYISEGLPQEKGEGAKEYKIDTAKAIEWIFDRRHGKKKPGKQELNQAQAKARLDSANAELREYELAEKRGLMVSVDDVAAELAEVLHVVRTQIRSIKSSLSQVLSVETDPQVIERLIGLEVDATLTELSTYAESRVSPTQP